MAYCSQCGIAVPLTDHFCKDCGRKLIEVLPTEPHIQNASLPFRVRHAVGANRNLFLWFWVAAGVLTLFWVFVHPTRTLLDPAKSAPPPTKAETALPTQPKNFSMKDTVSTGYWSYVVWDKEWQRTLDSGSAVRQAYAHFLVVRITVINNDSSASVIPPFKLMDELGREYETSSSLVGGFGPLKTVNPGVRAEGYIAFEVPQDIYELSRYQLKVSGGFKSAQTEKINLY
jgi:hypothetical protein